ncbi:MAG: HAMP domain-containing sensor histidine kinase [Capnocytophaga sp.]|nr:HAMP domain-containing sensor histidine kinase [Capnocytophaga sp.]
MKISLKNYTLRYLTIAFLLIMAIWALVFYAYILEEVYDNVDDGLKDRKNEILLQISKNDNLLNINEFGVEGFRIYPTKNKISHKNELSNEFFYMPYDDEEEPYRVLKTGFYAENGTPYILEIRTSTIEEDDLLLNLAIALMVLYVVLVITMYAINIWLIHKIWKPFRLIINNIDNYRIGNKEQLQPIKTNVIEFTELNQNIQQMWQRNEAIFEEQKIFIENASHELQTPLAITINKLELILEDESLTETQLIQLAQTKTALSRMVNLNKSLLMLSRIENGQYKQTENINFKEIIENLLEEFKDLIHFKEISLRFLGEKDFYFQMNKDLSVILVSNLLRNAIKHNLKGGNIEIIVENHCFLIKNTGKSISLDKKMIFKRFHKGEQDSSSTGLGLAIVKSIVDLYKNLEIQYFFEEEKHIFKVFHKNV